MRSLATDFKAVANVKISTTSTVVIGWWVTMTFVSDLGSWVTMKICICVPCLTLGAGNKDFAPNPAVHTQVH